MEERGKEGEGRRESVHTEGETQEKRVEKEVEGQTRGQTDPRHIQSHSTSRGSPKRIKTRRIYCVLIFVLRK